MNISRLFTTKENYFLPLGNISSVQTIMDQNQRVFWDGSWTFEGRSTRSLVFFCEEYHRGYKQRKAFTSIAPPSLYMFSADTNKELISDVLFYPGDTLFQDQHTTVECIGMIPLSLKQKETQKRIDAQLVHVSLFDKNIHMNLFILLWLHPTPVVFKILEKYEPAISYYWEKTSIATVRIVRILFHYLNITISFRNTTSPLEACLDFQISPVFMVI